MANRAVTLKLLGGSVDQSQMATKRKPKLTDLKLTGGLEAQSLSMMKKAQYLTVSLRNHTGMPELIAIGPKSDLQETRLSKSSITGMVDLSTRMMKMELLYLSMSLRC